MSKLWLFRIGCSAAALASLLVMGAELFLKQDFSMTVLYIAGGFAVSGLMGNAGGAIAQYQRGKKGKAAE